MVKKEMINNHYQVSKKDYSALSRYCYHHSVDIKQFDLYAYSPDVTFKEWLLNEYGINIDDAGPITQKDILSFYKVDSIKSLKRNIAVMDAQNKKKDISPILKDYFTINEFKRIKYILELKGFRQQHKNRYNKFNIVLRKNSQLLILKYDINLKIYDLIVNKTQFNFNTK